MVLAELKSRQLPIPEKEKTKKLVWRVGENGHFLKSDGGLYTPTEKQSNFINSNAQFSALISARAGGKTAAGAQKALNKIKQGESGSVLNPDFENFKYSTWPELKMWIPWDMVVPEQQYRKEEHWEPHKPFTMVFQNEPKPKMFCKGLRDPDSARGPNINWLWYDEGTRDKDGKGWKLAVASVRIGHEPQRFTTATPRGKDNWVFNLFVKKEIPDDVIKLFDAMGGIKRPIVEWWGATIEENKNNLDPGFYASMLMAYPPGWMREQELGGEFVDEGGILGDPAWFKDKMLGAIPEDVVLRSVIRYWDLAASEKKIAGKRSDDPDETVGTLMGWDGHNFYIMDQVAGYWAYKEIKTKISQIAAFDGSTVPIYIEQEPGAGGKNQVADIADDARLGNYSVRAHKPEGDKILRANIWFAEAASGRVFIVRGLWVDHFFSQLSSFPVGRKDDTIDSISGGRMCIAPIRQWKKMKFMAIGMG
jgi:predicted phage terminase large subunit-like protein